MSDDVGTERVIKRGRAVLAPLYEPTRLLKGGVLDARQVLAEAKERRAQVERELDERRRRIGEELEQARREAREEERRQAAEEFGELIRRADAEVGRLRDRMAREATLLAFDLAEVVLGSELEGRPGRVLDLVEQVARSAARYDRLTLVLHPADAEVARGGLERVRASLGFAQEVEVVADATLPRFEVRVMTEMGEYGGGLETSLARLREQLLLEIGRGGEHA